MGKSPSLGQYYPVDSALHRLDPRVKVIVLLTFVIAVFFVDRTAVLAVGLLVVPLLLLLAKMPPGWLLRSVKPLIFILAFTFLIHLFFTPGEAILRIGPLAGTETGLSRGAFFALRLILVVTVSSFITLTTTPMGLTDALEALLKPFKKVGLPVHELALMTTIALRFIPTLLGETEDIIKAQKARGADFESGNMFKRAKSFVPVLVPLFVGAFRRADDLAVAMEARGYAGGEGRTRLHLLRLRKADYIWLVAGALLIAGFLLVDQGGSGWLIGV